jgi:formiminoglutamase
MNLTHFNFYKKSDLQSLTQVRKFETKLGETVQTAQQGLTLQKELDQSTASYVIFGIPEDMGVQANMGAAGASQAWPLFLKSFLNAQSNDFLEGDEILLLGAFDFKAMQELIDKMALNEEEKIGAFRHAVNTIDAEVEGLAKAIVQAGKTPIVIGGGHNNAYPLLKGAAKGLQQSGKIDLPQINCINLDAHSGYGPAEGRHSDNPFRYAEDDGFLQKYCIIGLQETYLQQNVWVDLVNNPFMDCITFEDIFVRGKRTFVQAVADAVDFTAEGYTVVELDLDAVQGLLATGASPAGISAREARQYITLTASAAQTAYLHICEGAANFQNGGDGAVGQLIAYLVTDFIKALEENAD